MGLGDRCVCVCVNVNVCAREKEQQGDESESVCALTFKSLRSFCGRVIIVPWRVYFSLKFLYHVFFFFFFKQRIMLWLTATIHTLCICVRL